MERAEPYGPAVRVEHLVKRFGGVTAVDGLSFDVAAGEIFGLVGPDGGGKTTTMRMLAGVMAPDSGAASVAGFNVVADPESVKGYISYMPQRFGLYEDLTVDENIRFYADLFGLDRSRREEHASRLLKAAGMAEFRGRLAGKLSGGMKQKLGLTCALIHKPRVLLLDEPTTGVDPISRREFWEILYSLLAENVTIVISTAYLDEAERCSRLALLFKGRAMLCDTPEALKRQMPGEVVLLTSERAREIAALLANAEGVSNVMLTGDSVHLVVDSVARRIPEIERRLETASIPIGSIERSEPTIEDLFVAYAGAAN